MAPQELLRIYISLEPEDLKKGRREWNQKVAAGGGGDLHGTNPEDEFDLQISLAHNQDNELVEIYSTADRLKKPDHIQLQRLSTPQALMKMILVSISEDELLKLEGLSYVLSAECIGYNLKHVRGTAFIYRRNYKKLPLKIIKSSKPSSSC